MHDYDKTRDRPDLDGTSRVSAYLAVGVLSPRQCLNALLTEVPDAIWQSKGGGSVHEGPRSLLYMQLSPGSVNGIAILSFIPGQIFVASGWPLRTAVLLAIFREFCTVVRFVFDQPFRPYMKLFKQKYPVFFG